MTDCSVLACARNGCQATIHIHHDVEERLRRTHETFYCPAGHRNYFPGKTEEQQKITRLERDRERFIELWGEALEQRDEWKLRAKTCPLGCGWRVLRKSNPESIEVELMAHLVEAHGAQLPVNDNTDLAFQADIAIDGIEVERAVSRGRGSHGSL